MKKELLAVAFSIAGLGLGAQTPRLSLFEEFTGETCPPCAATNPGLNALLALPQNTANCVALKWQVPIPSAPTATWSLYQTNKTEINWRYSTYGYGINSAPSGRMDGQSPTVFGATSAHPATLNSNVIATAASYTSAFSVTLNRAWDPTYSSVNVTVNIVATAPFTAVGNLKFRLVMVEKYIEFATQPGTNGEKIFEDVAIKSFPSIQNGTSMLGTWTVGQTQTFTLNCPLPSYVRDKGEVAFVGFIQDDGNRQVAQAVRADKDPIPNDAKAVSVATPSYFACSNSVVPDLVVKNNGGTAITAMTITPTSGTTTASATNWSGSLAPNSTVAITLNGLTSTIAGGQNWSFNISAVSGVDGNTANNIAATSFYLASDFNGVNVAEGFVSTTFPPAQFGIENADGGSSWSKATNAGGFGTSSNSAKYDFYNNNNVGDADYMYLPPLDLTGAGTPSLTFDVAYSQYDATTDDRLEVLVSDDCGQNWTSVYDQQGAALATNGGPVTAAFIPSSSSWRKETIALTSFNLGTILVKFKATSDYGNNMYLDNINLFQPNPTGLATVSKNDVGVQLFPNPAQSSTSLKITVGNASAASISVVNVLGQVVISQQAALTGGENNVQLDVAKLANGVYNVVVDAENGHTVKKLTVAH